MKIIIPIAGKTVDESQSMKILYEIGKKAILEHVYKSLSKIQNAEFIFILKREDVSRYHIDDMIKLLVPNVKIIIAEGKALLQGKDDARISKG